MFSVNKRSRLLLPPVHVLHTIWVSMTHKLKTQLILFFLALHTSDDITWSDSQPSQDVKVGSSAVSTSSGQRTKSGLGERTGQPRRSSKPRDNDSPHEYSSFSDAFVPRPLATADTADGAVVSEDTVRSDHESSNPEQQNVCAFE